MHKHLIYFLIWLMIKVWLGTFTGKSILNLFHLELYNQQEKTVERNSFTERLTQFLLECCYIIALPSDTAQFPKAPRV